MAQANPEENDMSKRGRKPEEISGKFQESLRKVSGISPEERNNFYYFLGKRNG